MTERKIKVMIVDDSATARRILAAIVNNSNDMVVSSSVEGPYEAVEELKKGYPDVIVLDVQMPRMDGITFLKKIMAHHPLPVVMCSSFTERGSSNSLQCLESGAVDIIAKPRITSKDDMLELEMRVHDVIHSASQARFKLPSAAGAPSRFSKTPEAAPQFATSAKYSADEILPAASKTSIASIPTKMPRVIAVGASTGGTDAIRVFLSGMPTDCPGIVMVQHMPEHFTKSFADRLNDVCGIRVKEAANGDVVEPGLALLAPGNMHLALRRRGNSYFVELIGGALVSRHRPSVDVLFRSTAGSAGANAVGVILTGMGDDGAAGMLEMKNAGAYNFAQDKDSCVVFGMPNEAIKAGGVHETLPLNKIAAKVVQQLVPARSTA